MRPALAVLLCLIAADASAQQRVRNAAPAIANDDAIDLDTVRVTAPRPKIQDLYRSKPPERTAPTVFDKAWREPVNLKKIGDEGGVVPLLVNYAARKIAKGARKLPGWNGPDQPAEARPSPLDDQQMERALQLREDRAGVE